MKNSVAVFFLLAVFHLTPTVVSASNPCFSTLSDTAVVSVPAMSFEGSLYAFSLEYSATGPVAGTDVWFMLIPGSFGTSARTDCTYPAPLLLDSGKIILRLPMVLYPGGSLWAELEVQGIGGQVWLKVTNAGFMPNRAFVTSVKGNGNLGSWAGSGGKTGLEAGDAICQERAEAAQLPGTYRAWLSDDGSDAYCRVHNLGGKKSANCGQTTLPASAGPWVRTDGFPFGERIDRLIEDGEVFVPMRVDESGNGMPSPTFYYTNTSPDGALFSYIPSPCGNWTSASDTSVLNGLSDRTTSYWTWYSNSRCDASVPILCLQTGSGSALPPFWANGKRVFLTSVIGNGNLASWADAGGHVGLAAGDAICQARASFAGLQGTFKAWLSDGSTDAVTRLSSNGPWVRLDGVPVAGSKSDLTDGVLYAPINLTETMQYVGGHSAWTGTAKDGKKTANTCNGWTSSADTSDGTRGIASDAARDWTSNSAACSRDFEIGLYCFQD